MNNQASKTSQNAKSRAQEAKYLKFRSYKPKYVESSVPACAKEAKRVRHHKDKKMVRVRPKESADDKVDKRWTPATKRHQTAKKDNSKRQSRSPDDPSAQIIKKPKTETKIQTEARKPHAEDAESAASRNPSKNYKTLDIASFPRVFSTSDLMEKMNESDDSVRDKCNFDNVNATDSESQQNDARIVDALQNVGLNIELLSNTAGKRVDDTNKEEKVIFALKIDALAFGSNEAFLTTYRGDLINPEERALVLELESKRKLVQLLAAENDTLKTQNAKQRVLVGKLQSSVRQLEKELRENNRLKDHFKSFNKKDKLVESLENQMKMLSREKQILEEKISEKDECISRLMRRNEEISQLLSQATGSHDTIRSLQSELHLYRNQVHYLLREHYELKKANEELNKKDGDSELTVAQLKDIIDKQKTSLKLLENVERSEMKQLGIYEMENNRLHEISAKLATENEKFRNQNRRLLNVVALQILSTGQG